MTFLSFDEKAWDKVRPSSVKKTGVSEALRAVEKLVPKKADDLDAPSACSAAVEAVDTLVDKLQGAKRRFDAKKHEDAVKKVTGWVSEIAVRRKLITNQADALYKGYDQALAEANQEMDPYFERAEEAKSSAQDLHSRLLDLAKQAMLAGAKGDNQTLQQCRNGADELKKTFDKLKAGAKHLHANAVKAVMAKMPSIKELNETQAKRYETMVTRSNAIKVKVSDLDVSEEKIAKALESVAKAGGRGEQVQEQFVGLIKEDIEALELLAMEIGATESSIGMDLEQTKGRLNDAGKEGVEPVMRQQYGAQASKWLKDAIGKLKRLDKQIAEINKSLESKVNGYPDFVTAQDPRFGKLVKQLDNLREFVQEKRTVSQPARTQETKQLGLRLQELLSPQQK